VACRGGWRKKGAAVSTALLGLRASAVDLSSAGAFWQLVSYLRLEYTNMVDLVGGESEALANDLPP